MEYQVSVIIPTYKRSDMLPRAIDSVLNQTYKNVQVVVVDDNNPDTEYRKKTAEMMRKYAGDSRVKYILHDKNRNGSAARNTGIRNSKCDFFCFLDDDDCYYSEKIKKQVNFIIENKIDACFCDYKKNGVAVIVDKNIDIAKNILLAKQTPQTSGWMITSQAVEILGGFDENYYRHQDYEFLLRFIRAGFSIKKLDEILYERNVSGVDNRPSGKKTEGIKAKLFSDFSDFIEMYSKKDNQFKKELYFSAHSAAFINYLRDKDLGNAIRMFGKCLKISVVKSLSLVVEKLRKRS